jgi:hypothetical protein
MDAVSETKETRQREKPTQMPKDEGIAEEKSETRWEKDKNRG